MPTNLGGNAFCERFAFLTINCLSDMIIAIQGKIDALNYIIQWGLYIMKKLSKEEVFRDIYKNHNNSWIVEIFERNKNRMDYTAITYRGLKISYSEFKEKVEEYTKALRAQGLKKGDRFLVSIPNTPEYVYFLGAASAIGAVIDIGIGGDA